MMFCLHRISLTLELHLGCLYIHVFFIYIYIVAAFELRSSISLALCLRMQGLFILLISILLSAASPSSCSRVAGLLASAAGNTFNVIDYGAVGNGQTDDSQVKEFP